MYFEPKVSERVCILHPCLTLPRKSAPHNPHWENLAWGLCGELPTRQNLVWGAPRQPHTKCILFFRPHAIPTQSPPILMYICNPHAFWYILFQSPHILPYPRSENHLYKSIVSLVRICTIHLTHANVNVLMGFNGLNMVCLVLTQNLNISASSKLALTETSPRKPVRSAPSPHKLPL